MGPEIGVDLSKYGYTPEDLEQVEDNGIHLSTGRLVRNLHKDPATLVGEVTDTLGRFWISQALGVHVDLLDRWQHQQDQPDEISRVKLAICADFIERMKVNYPPDGSISMTVLLFNGVKEEFGGRSMAAAMGIVEPEDLAFLHGEFIGCQVAEHQSSFSTGVSGKLWKYFGK